jgi:hypothetical protein
MEPSYQKEYVAPKRATPGGRMADIVPKVAPDAKLTVVALFAFTALYRSN